MHVQDDHFSRRLTPLFGVLYYGVLYSDEKYSIEIYPVTEMLQSTIVTTVGFFLYH